MNKSSLSFKYSITTRNDIDRCQWKFMFWHGKIYDWYTGTDMPYIGGIDDHHYLYFLFIILQYLYTYFLLFFFLDQNSIKFCNWLFCCAPTFIKSSFSDVKTNLYGFYSCQWRVIIVIDLDKESIYCEINVSINVWFKDYL